MDNKRSGNAVSRYGKVVLGLALAAGLMYSCNNGVTPKTPTPPQPDTSKNKPPVVVRPVYVDSATKK